MTGPQITISSILVVSMVLFIWGRWRYDIVAGGALIACVLAGLVSEADAFSGFSHPAVITVACVLILSYGLQSTGVVDVLIKKIIPSSAGTLTSIVALTCIAGVLSGFINNVAAMALLMPVAIQLAGRQNITPGKFLMPVAFASILGGTVTLIGTPPNIIVAGFRAEVGPAGFAMFDFTPVGLAVAGTGILFLSLAGWRIVPVRKQVSTGGFDTGAYITEVEVLPDSKAAGKTLYEVEKMLEESDAQILGMVRNDLRITAPHSRRILKPGDVLIIEAEPEAISSVLSSLELKMGEDVAGDVDNSKDLDSKGKNKKASDTSHKTESEKAASADDVALSEFVVLPNSRIIGRSASDILLRTRYGINLLAVSRQGKRSIRRLRSAKIKAGDVLLLQGFPEALSEFSAEFACIPLAKRAIGIHNRKRAVVAAAVMILAVSAAALGIISAAVSFAAGALLIVLFRVVPLRAVYEEINWPVIVLLGAMFPVAGAMSSTGTADLAAMFLVENVARGNPVVLLAVIIIATMTLSDFMNNAATAALMCPIAISVAAQAGINSDSLLMAVAVGASCAFLTPIGHQNNTLILGPGGFRFGDYWRLGLLIEIIVVAVSVPMIMKVWPL